jgi:hypothetical protein
MSFSRHVKSRASLRAALVLALSGMPLTVAHAEGAAAEHALDPKALFAEAVKLYKAGKFGEALPQFETLSNETLSPNAALYVGYCLKALGRTADAYGAFESSAKRAGNEERYAETRSAAVAELTDLGLRVAKLVVSPVETPPGLVVRLDGRPLEPAAFGAHRVLDAGDHRIEAEAPGREAIVETVHVEGGETRTVTLYLKEPHAEPATDTAAAHDSRSGLRIGGFVGVGIGVAGLTTFMVAGLGAKSVHADLEHDCGSAPCLDAAHRDDAERGRTLQTLANVGLGVGVVGAVAGGTLLYFGYKGHPSAPAVGWSVVPGGMTANVRGRF